MAKKKRQSGADIDWYLISIDRLKKFGIVLALLIIGVGAFFYVRSQRADPRERAQNAISEAQASLSELASSKELTKARSDFDRAQEKLTEAQTLFNGGKFGEAQSAAVESQSITRAALARQPGAGESDAQFLTVEGNVQYQKSSSSDWKNADPRTPLSNGDWVKTGDRASAELIFSNGSLFTIGPNALLEIYAVVNPQTSKKQNSVQMQIGSVEINTTDDISTVRTPGTQVVVESESTTQVGVDRSAKSQVVSLKGASSVTSITGGEAIRLASGEQVQASKEGTMSPVRKVVPPPALLTPADNQIFQGASNSKVTMTWATQPLASGYQFQVSRTRLFAALEINVRRPQTEATTKVTSEGAFYWRAASIDDQGGVGPFSPFRRFRIGGLGTATATDAGADRTPPTLELKRPFGIGGPNYIIEGKVESGATVFVNDLEIDVEADGTFKKVFTFEKVGTNIVVIKAVDAAGNPTVQRQTVQVAEE